MDSSETFSDLGENVTVSSPDPDEDFQLIFEQGGVSQKITTNTNKRKKETLIPGKLLLTENKHGLFVEWKPEEVPSRNSCSPDPASRPISSSPNGRDWAMIHGSPAGIGFHAGKEDAIEFVPDPRAAEYLRPIKLELIEIRSFLIPSKSNERELNLILADGTTQNPLIFEKGSTDNLVCALKRHATITRSRSNKDLYMISPKKDEVAGMSHSQHTPLVAELFPEHMHQFNQVFQLYTDLRNDPKAVAFTALAKIADYALSNGNGNNERPTTNGHSSRSPGPVAESLDADYTTNDDGYEVVFKPEKLSIELGVRPNTYRGQQLSQEVWMTYLDNEGRIKNYEEIKQIIFLGGIEPAIRKHVWVFLLGVYESSSTFEERQAQLRDYETSYNRMKTQWTSFTEDQEERFHTFRDFKSLIDKDVARTDKTLEYYQDGSTHRGSELLRNILLTYMMYNFNLGYVQGMSDILAPILMEVQDEVLAFWIFVKFMDRIHTNFEMSQEGMQRQLRNSYTLLQLVDPRFSAYLDACDASNMYFAFRWLLILYKREFSTDDIMTLWEALWTELPGPNLQLFVGLAILEKHRHTIMENKFGLSEILRHVNDLSMRIELNETLCTAEAIYRQLLNVEHKLPNNIRVIIGLEERDEPASASESSASFSPEPTIEEIPPGPRNNGSGDAQRITTNVVCASPTVEEQSLELNCDIGMSQFL